MTTFYTIVGSDAHGIPRVYATDTNEADTYAFCRAEARDYVRRRPDTGPLSAWLFEPDAVREIGTLL